MCVRREGCPVLRRTGGLNGAPLPAARPDAARPVPQERGFCGRGAHQPRALAAHLPAAQHGDGQAVRGGGEDPSGGAPAPAVQRS